MGLRSLPFFKAKKGWQFAGSGLDGGSGSSYKLPIASKNDLGGIKVGNGLSITDLGVLSVLGGIDLSLNETVIGKYKNQDLFCKIIEIANPNYTWIPIYLPDLDGVNLVSASLINIDRQASPRQDVDYCQYYYTAQDSVSFMVYKSSTRSEHDYSYILNSPYMGALKVEFMVLYTKNESEV